ncbi:hypothetical protein GCM10027592_18750 [Spirosoma flavus]
MDSQGFSYLTDEFSVCQGFSFVSIRSEISPEISLFDKVLRSIEDYLTHLNPKVSRFRAYVVRFIGFEFYKQLPFALNKHLIEF